MEKKMFYFKRGFFWFLWVLFFILIFLYFTRLLLPRQIDDVNPFMECTDELLLKSDVFYVVPLYDNKPINETREWCEYILLMNKTLHLHGIKHTYKEFKEEIEKKDIEYAINIFEDCFGFKPTRFKAPQLAITKENKKIVKEFGMNVDGYLNQLFNKVYHCNDSGILPNLFHDFL